MHESQKDKIIPAGFPEPDEIYMHRLFIYFNFLTINPTFVHMEEYYN